MTDDALDAEVIAINLIPMRPGVDPARFADFSASVDQPTCTAKDVVLSFNAYRVSEHDATRLGADIVEVMRVRSWREWERVRDHDPDLEPVTTGFEELADPATVRTFFVTPIGHE
jgi:hypothetical protein